MMRILSLSFAAFAALIAAAPVLGAERTYTVTDFDRVQIDGAYRVTLAPGRASSARATGSQEALDRISVDVLGRTLRIRPNQSAWGGSTDPRKLEAPSIVLATQDLRAVTVNGAGLLSTDGVQAMRFDVALSGSGQIAIANLNADSLLVNLLGSGTIRISGKAKNVRAEIHGAGNFEANGLTTSDAQIFADSAGTVAITATRSASVAASASGDVEILGSAACTVKQTGTGAVSCRQK